MKSAFEKIISLSNRVSFIDDRQKQSAVLVPFFQNGNSEEIVFEVRSPFVVQPGEICFPGGNRKSSDPSMRKTAVRETCEELAISPSSVSEPVFLGEFNSAAGRTIHVFTAALEIDSLKSLKPDVNEVSSVFSVEADYFLSNEPEIYHVSSLISPFKNGSLRFPAAELGLPEMYHSEWGHADREVPVYRTEHGIIWGITAKIIRDIFKVLK